MFANFYLSNQLLQRNPAKRLGSGKDGADEIKNHKFFEGINWKDVEKRYAISYEKFP